MIFLSAPFQNGNEKKYINDALDSNYLAPVGRYVDLFKEELCKYFNTQNVSLTTSGTSSLVIALKLAGVKYGDNVLTSSFTFAGAISPIVHANANPIMLGVQDDGNVSMFDIIEAIYEYRPKAIVITHILGKKNDFSKIVELCKRNKIKIIEDVAQTLGNKQTDNYENQLSDYAIYSFNGNKMITTSGGGALICKNSDDTHLANILITQGIERSKGKLECVYSGYNFAPSNILCALGLAQLEQIHNFVEIRQEHNREYSKKLNSDKLIQEAKDSVCWLTGAVLDGMCIDTLITHLQTKGIETRRAFKPIYSQEFYKDSMRTHSRLGLEQSIYKSTIMLPSSPKVSSKEIDIVCNEINRYIDKQKTE